MTVLDPQRMLQELLERIRALEEAGDESVLRMVGVESPQPPARRRLALVLSHAAARIEATRLQMEGMAAWLREVPNEGQEPGQPTVVSADSPSPAVAADGPEMPAQSPAAVTFAEEDRQLWDVWMRYLGELGRQDIISRVSEVGQRGPIAIWVSALNELDRLEPASPSEEARVEGLVQSVLARLGRLSVQEVPIPVGTSIRDSRLKAHLDAGSIQASTLPGSSEKVVRVLRRALLHLGRPYQAALVLVGSERPR